MPTAIVDDPTQFPVITSPSGTDVPNAASLQTSVQQLANRTSNLDKRLTLQGLVASTWFKKTSGVSVNLLAVAASLNFNGSVGHPPRFCAVGVGPGPCTILTSPDGDTWTSQTSVGTSTTAFAVGFTFGGATQLVVLMNGASGQNVQISTTGAAWSLATSGIVLSNSRGGVCHFPNGLGIGVGSGRWCIVGGVGGAAAVSTSDDGGGTWTPRTLGTSVNQMTHVVFASGPNIYIATGYNTSTFAIEVWTSPDGLTWTQRPLVGGTSGTTGLVAASLPRIAWSNPQQVALITIDGTTACFMSTNGGTVWSITNPTANGGFVLWASTQWIISNSAPSTFISSGVDPSPPKTFLKRAEVAYPFNWIDVTPGGQMIAVGTNGLIYIGLTSPVL